MRRWGALAAAAVLSACASDVAQLPPAPVAAGAAITVDAEPVPMDPTAPGRAQVGAFTYAGGVVLTSQQTSRLHGLSDLKVEPDGRLLAVGDQSDLLEARIVLDGQGRLVGLADARLTALKDVTGADLYAGGQREHDSEGVARLGNGDIVVSFEQHDRILVFPAAGGLPRPAPMPQTRIVDNQGMEALVAAPEVAPDAYRVGLESNGLLFLCRLSTACVPDGRVEMEGPDLVAMDRMPDGGRVYLFRTFTAAAGNVVKLRIVDRRGRTRDTLQIARPMTVDNFEGVAAVPRGRGVRFYLVSDDNFGFYQGRATGQRTLLLAFDWTPAK